MSTIKSSNEHLTLNADGSSKDIKFQANGVEKASISSAGAFTSTTIDATKLTGTIPNFTSTGIDDNADATAMTISSSEKVRVGATNQTDKALLSTWQDNTDAGTSIGGTNLAMAMQHYGGANSVVQMGLGYCVNHPPAVIGYQVETNSGNTKGDIFFATRDTTNDIAPTERMRINVGGNVGIGGTPADKLDVFGGVGMFRRSDVNSGSAERIVAFKDGSNTERGSIKISNSAVTYTTGSDYRLKENVDYTWDATTRLKQLKPARFNFIEDDTNTLVDGFIAHEVSSVVPEAISGEKDAFQVWEAFETLPEGVSVGDNKLDDDGNRIPLMQSIDQSKLVPLLVKTIQELEARIAALEA